MSKRTRAATKPATRKSLAARAKTRRRRDTESEDAMLAAYYDKMLVLQHGACAICRHKFEQKLKIDRDPHTGLLRGLLCPGCVKLIATIQHVWKYRHRFYVVLTEWYGEKFARKFWRAYRCDIPDRWERKQRASVH
jgi:hypothetical protein